MPIKIKDICERNNIDFDDFMCFLTTKNIFFYISKFHYVIDDNYEETYVNMYKDYLSSKDIGDDTSNINVQQQREIETQDEAEQLEAEKKKKLSKSKILISSGFNFEGYKIVKYSGYISGDDAVFLPERLSNKSKKNGQYITDALVKIRRVALDELKEAAYNLGCNAVIGVDFDYITIEPGSSSALGLTTNSHMICVTANGNAVIIEKEKD